MIDSTDVDGVDVGEDGCGAGVEVWMFVRMAVVVDLGVIVFVGVHLGVCVGGGGVIGGRGGGTFSNQVRLSIRLLVNIQKFYILPWHRLK
jgi:hypothetical protein